MPYNFVALVSGGKDSFFALSECLGQGHRLLALANLHPAGGQAAPEELDSFMFQTVGWRVVDAYAACLAVPLVRAPLQGTALQQGLAYAPAPDAAGDEVEDLHRLLARVQAQFPALQAVCCGAILSHYQRYRVESVCGRLGLVSLAPLWQLEQRALLQRMVALPLEAVLVKVAAMGLKEAHLGRPLAALAPLFRRLNDEFGFHECGEGGEYESLALDAPFFRHRIVLDRTEVLLHSDDAFAPVAHLCVRDFHLEEKEAFQALLPPLPAQGHRTHAEPHALQEHALQEHALQEEALQEHTLQEEALQEEALQEHTLQEHALQEEALQEVVLEQALQEWGGGGAACEARVAGCWAAACGGGGMGVEGQLAAVLDALDGAARACGTGLRQAALLRLYLRDMGDFGRANAVYRARLGVHLPPARECVGLGARMPPGQHVAAEALLLPAASRHVLHVQSVSGWAPACIGPYSQAAVAHGHTALLAGMIGLEPSAMSLRPAAEQLHMALCSLARVLRAVKSAPENVTAATAYATAAFAAAHGGPDKAAAHLAAAWHGWEARCPLPCVEVEELPRGAAVELQVNGRTDAPAQAWNFAVAAVTAEEEAATTVAGAARAALARARADATPHGPCRVRLFYSEAWAAALSPSPRADLERVVAEAEPDLVVALAAGGMWLARDGAATPAVVLAEAWGCRAPVAADSDSDGD